MDNSVVVVYARLQSTGNIQQTKILTEFETREKYLSNAPFLVQIDCVTAENEPFQKVEQKWNIFLRIVFSMIPSSVGSHLSTQSQWASI